jgi:hypothetical protein
MRPKTRSARGPRADHQPSRARRRARSASSGDAARLRQIGAEPSALLSEVINRRHGPGYTRPETRSSNAPRLPRARRLSQTHDSIEWEPCGRRGRYNVAKLIEKYGRDIKLPDLRHVLENCPKVNAQSVNDRCKVRYGADSRLS